MGEDLTITVTVLCVSDDASAVALVMVIWVGVMAFTLPIYLEKFLALLCQVSIG